MNNTMPSELTTRNGFIVSDGLKIVRGGLGEFLICNGETCVQVCRSYDDAQAFTKGAADAHFRRDGVVCTKADDHSGVCISADGRCWRR